MARYLRRLSLIVCSFWMDCALQREYTMRQPLNHSFQNDLDKVSGRENETFNTLKNQGYNFEHNYGHGEQHLSGVCAVLRMLAFLVDQTQPLCCAVFQAVW